MPALVNNIYVKQTLKVDKICFFCIQIENKIMKELVIEKCFFVQIFIFGIDPRILDSVHYLIVQLRILMASNTLKY